MRLWVDFNEIEDGQYIEADLEFADFFLASDLAPGQAGDLFDGAGHQCRGTVVEVSQSQGLVKLAIDWDTWTSPARKRVFEPASLRDPVQPSWAYSPEVTTMP